MMFFCISYIFLFITLYLIVGVDQLIARMDEDELQVLEPEF